LQDDVVVGVAKGYSSNSLQLNRAYPHVVTTYANMSKAACYWLAKMYNDGNTYKNARLARETQLTHSQGVALTATERQQIEQMPRFFPMGISSGVAYAHPDSGDTVGTVMYGGQRTILNGPFEARTKQPMMWIFDFETNLFDSEGRRLKVPSSAPTGRGHILADDFLPSCIEVCTWQRERDLRLHISLTCVLQDGYDEINTRRSPTHGWLDFNDTTRKQFHERENGVLPGYPGKKNIFYIKPYVPREDEPHVMDKERIFGEYTSSARPFEKVDIIILRLAL